MAKKNFNDVVFYSVFKTSYNSSKTTFDKEHTFNIIRIMIDGIGECICHPQIGLTKNKEEAKNGAYVTRDREAYHRKNARYGYASYKSKVWIHEAIKRSGSEGEYLPTVGEIKKALEFIKDNLATENFNRDWMEWYIENEGKKPSQIREELIKDYLSFND